MTATGSDLVSVILPAFNAERFIVQAVRSAVEQTYAPIEIIVIDDGSTDATAELAKSVSPKVEVIRQANAGVFAARNAGARHARGSFLSFLDADDWWERDKLAKQMAVFQRHPELAVVSAWGYEVDEDGRKLDRGLEKPPCPFDRVANIHRRLLRCGNCVPLSTSLVRRRAFDDAGGFYTRERIVSADYEFWIRLSERHLFYLMSDTLGYYRVLRQSVLHGSPEKEYGAQLNILRMHRHRFNALSFRMRLSRLYRDWADSAIFEGHRDGWPIWRMALRQNPLNLSAWLLGARVAAVRTLRRRWKVP